MFRLTLAYQVPISKTWWFNMINTKLRHWTRSWASSIHLRASQPSRLRSTKKIPSLSRSSKWTLYEKYSRVWSLSPLSALHVLFAHNSLVWNALKIDDVVIFVNFIALSRTGPRGHSFQGWFCEQRICICRTSRAMRDAKSQRPCEAECCHRNEAKQTTGLAEFFNEVK